MHSKEVSKRRDFHDRVLLRSPLSRVASQVFRKLAPLLHLAALPTRRCIAYNAQVLPLLQWLLVNADSKDSVQPTFSCAAHIPLPLAVSKKRLIDWLHLCSPLMLARRTPLRNSTHQTPVGKIAC